MKASIIFIMAEFKFYIPVQVRYSDIDPQWHVNNSRFLSYIEQARFAYLLELGLWNGQSYLDLGIIVADIHMAYVAPIELRQKVRVGMRTAHIGNKSLRFEYLIEDSDTGAVLGRAETVMVAYDYHTKTSMPVPDAWRKKITEFEGLE